MDIKLTEEKMTKCIKSLEHNLQKVRTGRANPMVVQHHLIRLLQFLYKKEKPYALNHMIHLL